MNSERNPFERRVAAQMAAVDAELAQPYLPPMRSAELRNKRRYLRSLAPVEPEPETGDWGTPLQVRIEPPRYRPSVGERLAIIVASILIAIVFCLGIARGLWGLL